MQFIESKIGFLAESGLFRRQHKRFNPRRARLDGDARKIKPSIELVSNKNIENRKKDAYRSNKIQLSRCQTYILRETLMDQQDLLLSIFEYTISGIITFFLSPLHALV